MSFGLKRFPLGQAFASALAVLLLGLLTATATAQGFERPGKAEGPTILRASVIAIDVDEINSAQQSFTANLFFMVRWQDDSLIHEGSGSRVIDMDEAWAPQFQLTNQQRVLRTFPEQLVVQPSGEVIYRQRVWGNFSQKLDLTEFPFDRQRFEVVLVAALPGLHSEEATIIQGEALPSGLAPGFSLPDWDIESWEATSIEYNPLGLERSSPGFAFAFEARRHIGYYLFKIMLPLLLIVMMSWIVFWVDPTEMGTQVSVSVTSMLTLIAYRFMVGGSLPTISYLTRMDLFILCSTLLVFTTLIEAVVTGTMAKSGHLERARRIDRVARLGYPLAMVFVIVATLIL